MIFRWLYFDPLRYQCRCRAASFDPRFDPLRQRAFRCCFDPRQAEALGYPCFDPPAIGRAVRVFAVISILSLGDTTEGHESRSSHLFRSNIVSIPNEPMCSRCD